MNFLLQSGDSGVSVAEMQAALSERDAEILRLQEELKASAAKREDTEGQVSLKGMLHPKSDLFMIKEQSLLAWSVIKTGEASQNHSCITMNFCGVRPHCRCTPNKQHRDSDWLTAIVFFVLNPQLYSYCLYLKRKMPVVCRMAGSRIVLLSFTFKSLIADVCFSFRSEQVTSHSIDMVEVWLLLGGLVWILVFHFIFKASVKNYLCLFMLGECDFEYNDGEEQNSRITLKAQSNMSVTRKMR